MKRTLLLAVVMGLGALVWPVTARAQTPVTTAPLDVTLVLDRGAYEPGMPFSFTVRVRNISSAPVALTFPTAQRIEVVLLSTSFEIDRWSRGQAFAQVVGELRLAPGEFTEFTGQWQPRNPYLPGSTAMAQNPPIGPGLYTLIAEVTAIGARAVSRPVFVIIGTAQTLLPGCTTLPRLLPAELPISSLVLAMDTLSGTFSIWQPALPLGAWAGYTVQPELPSDLQTLNRIFPITVCTPSGGRIVLPLP